MKIRLRKKYKNDQEMIRFLRQSFGSSSEALRKKYRFSEADPKVIRRRPEESIFKARQITSKRVKSRHSFHKWLKMENSALYSLH